MHGTKLDKARTIAQFFTMAAAVLSFLLWAVAGFEDADGALAVAQTATVALTCIGGVTMGVLYVAHLSTRREGA